MDTSTSPIVTTTTLSIVLHGVVVAGALLLPEVFVPAVEGVGTGLDVHLISSDKVANNHEAESLVKQNIVEPSAEQQKEEYQKILLAKNSRQDVFLSKTLQENIVDESVVIESVQSDQENDVAQYEQATSASQQQHSIVELLHSRISDKKEYPYIARRQRREGVATIAFVLHPNGKIENAHLVNSSRTQALDRAALSAVQDIEPFSAAQDYLEQSKKFQVDVAFNLL